MRRMYLVNIILNQPEWELILVTVRNIRRNPKELHKESNNGNTFSAIARVLVKRLNLDFTQESITRSLVGHIVAGVASEEEVQAFRKFCDNLE